MTRSADNSPYLGAACMVGSAFCFSLMTLQVKLLADALPSSEVVLARSVISLVISYGLLRRLGLSPWGTHRRLLLVRGLFGLGGLYCFYTAIPLLGLAEVTVLHFTNPVFVALLAAWLLAERFAPRDWLFVAAGLLGVVLVARPATLFGGGGAESIDPAAVGIALAGAFFSACAYVTVRRIGSREHPLVVVFYFPLVAVPACLPLALPDLVWPRGVEWLWLLGIGVTTQIAQVLMTRGLQLMPAGRATAVSTVQVLFAAGWGGLIFAEPIEAMTVVGAASIIVGVVMLTRARGR